MTPILKQFVAWGTDLRHKYRDDLFFRTTIHVIALQMALILVAVGLFAWILHIDNARVLEAVRAYVGNDSLSPVVITLQHGITAYLFIGLIALVTIFGTVLAYATLRPARESLHYQKLFISNIAHELRTPLSTIKTSTEVALLDSRLSPDTRETFELTVSELDRISDIINNLLSLNRLLRPERMEMSNVDIERVVSRVTERVAALARERGVTLSVREVGALWVWGNATALEQAIEHILKNAIHYTPKNQHKSVTVTYSTDQHGFITCTIQDEGVGIAQRDLFHIFEPFYRADLSRTRNVEKGGSGLGLAIVSEIIRLHKGKIRLQSTLGHGTAVSMALPTGEVPGTPAPGETGGDNTQNELSVDFSKSR